jgi:hypothetical protein
MDGFGLNVAGCKIGLLWGVVARLVWLIATTLFNCLGLVVPVCLLLLLKA